MPRAPSSFPLAVLRPGFVLLYGMGAWEGSLGGKSGRRVTARLPSKEQEGQGSSRCARFPGVSNLLHPHSGAQSCRWDLWPKGWDMGESVERMGVCEWRCLQKRKREEIRGRKSRCEQGTKNHIGKKTREEGEQEAGRER